MLLPRVGRGKEQAQEFWKDEKKVMGHIEQCKDEQKSKVVRGKDVLCAVLGACFSHALKESKGTLVSKPILDPDYTVLKSENEVLKLSLAFERETGAKLGIQVDQLVIQNNHLKTEAGHHKTEVDHLKALFAAAEHRETGAGKTGSYFGWMAPEAGRLYGPRDL